MSELAQISDVAVSHLADRRPLLWAGATTFDILLDGSQTGGSLGLLDQFGRRGDSTPLHVHRSEAEVFYLIEGSITAWAGDDSLVLDEGAAIYLPPDLPQAFRVDSDSARILTLTTLAGFADFVRTAGIPAEGDVPATWEFDLGRVMSAAPEYGIEILGPPPDNPPLPPEREPR
ncbi:MAG: cupin domain-containing protein [Nocardioidaceae bacterium]